MTAPATLDLERELSRRREETEEARLRQFDPGVLARLALLPEWTVALATAVELADRSLVDRLYAAGLVERRETLDAFGRRQEAFWIKSGVRPRLVRYVRELRGPRLLDDLYDLANRLAQQEPTDAGLATWLDLVRYASDPAAPYLMSTVDSHIEAGRIGDAASVVAIARTIGEVVGGTLAGAARRAGWRVELAQRTEEDTRHLRHYFRRDEVEHAFEQLLTPRAEHWALHLLGAGGVGKTMLVRYLASGRYAADRRMPRFPVARVDFDHLDPRYPQQRPAELLLVLAEELAGFATARGVYTAQRGFADTATALHEEMARATADLGRQASLLDGAVNAFARLLAELPGPVVLVLDTCEELAKLYALGSPAPAIDRTFELLEALWTRHPDVRVVLAGRRRLVPEIGGAPHAAGPLLLPRPYLRVLETRGFGRSEAEGYLDARRRARSLTDPGTPPVPDALVAAVLGRSAQACDGEIEYNPFELAAYCEWAFSEPDLNPADLRSAPGDPYVERRIIGRLGDGPARTGLGVAAELGRFDRDLAAPAWRRAGVDPDATFDALAAQEWVSTLSVGNDGRPRVIEIDPHLRDRIRDATKRSRESFPVDLDRLGSDAAAVIERTPLGELPAETVEAAVHLLGPDEAGPLWQSIEDRVVAHNEWAWAAQVVPRVAAVALERAERHPERPTILAAIFATQAATGVHTGLARGVVRELWESAARAVERYPAGEVREVLRARAMLGRIAAGDVNASLRDAAPDYRLPPSTPLGSVAAAVEARLVGGQIRLDADWERLQAKSLLDEQGQDPAVGATAAVTAAMFWRPDDIDKAIDQAAAAVYFAERAVMQRPEPWADWVPPRGLLDRCRLVGLYVAREAGAPLESVRWAAWRDEALTRTDDIDAERLVAMTVQFELDHHPVEQPTLSTLENAGRYVPGRRAANMLHRLVPSLVVAIAEARRVIGELDRAAGLLSTRLEEALQAGDDPDTVEECQLALLRLCRRQRDLDYLPSVRQLTRDGSTLVRAEVWLVLTLVAGESPSSPDEAGSWYAWWRCQDVRSLAAGARFPAPDRLEPGLPVVDSAAAAREYRLFVTSGPDRDDLKDDLGPIPRATLGPPGAAGRSTLEQCEVLALRFPRAVSALLERAALRLDEAADVSGEFQAYVAAALAAARAGQRDVAERAWRAAERLRREYVHPGGWNLRFEFVRAYVSGGTRPSMENSPELELWPQPPTGPNPVERSARASATARTTEPPAQAPAQQAPPAAPPYAPPSQPSYAPPPPSQPAYAPPSYAPPPYSPGSAPGSASGPQQPAYADYSGYSGSPPGPPTAAPESRGRRRTVWLILLGLVAALVLATVVIGLVTSGAPSTHPTGTPQPTPTATSTPPPSTSGGSGSGAALAWAAVASVAVPVLIGLLAIGTATWRHGYRFRAARTVLIGLDGGQVRLTAGVHRGIADLDGGWLPALGWWLRGNGRPRGWVGWSATLPTQGGAAGTDLRGLRLPSGGSRRGVSLVQLEVERVLHDYPWDRRLASAGPGVVAFRHEPGAPQPPPRRGERRAATVHLAWAPTPSRQRKPGEQTASSDWGADIPAARTIRHSLLYLAGTPVTTSAGWRMRVSGSTTSSAGSSGRWTLADEEVLALDRRAVNQRALVVLHAEPVDGPPRALGDDQRAGFVGLARAALDAGAPAVLIVPPLPDALADGVYQEVWHRVVDRRRRVRPSVLVALLARLNAMIPRAETEHPDLILYLRTR